MKKIEFRKVFLAISVAFSVNSARAQDSPTLTVLVEGAKANTGQAIASLFSTAENYLHEPIFEKTKSINADGGARFVFNGLEAGIYSISIVYDENSDGKLNTGLFGIPSELVGFSNNVNGIFGPPSFDKTSFAYSGSETITIVLNRAKK